MPAFFVLSFAYRSLSAFSAPFDNKAIATCAVCLGVHHPGIFPPGTVNPSALSMMLQTGTRRGKRTRNSEMGVGARVRKPIPLI